MPVVLYKLYRLLCGRDGERGALYMYHHFLLMYGPERHPIPLLEPTILPLLVEVRISDLVLGSSVVFFLPFAKLALVPFRAGRGADGLEPLSSSLGYGAKVGIVGLRLCPGIHRYLLVVDRLGIVCAPKYVNTRLCASEHSVACALPS